MLNALGAVEKGATVLTRWRCVDAVRGTDAWQVALRDAHGHRREISARSLVNAAGPWAASFLGEQAHVAQRKSLRLVEGSHIVVRRLFEHDDAYIFQNPDKRIIFAIPYEGDFTLIGTTDVEHRGAPGDARIDAAETAYLCEQASRYFARPVTPADAVWSYSGVRPLLDDESDDPSAVTRDYSLELDTRGAPLLSVWGGKITTFRKLAEEAADQLAVPLGLGAGRWTREAPLPGGDLSGWIGAPSAPDTDFDRFRQALGARHPHLPAALCHWLARAYGSRAALLLDAPLGALVAPGLHEAELHYLHDHAWARSADDVLWRRSKLGLHMTAAQHATVDAWCRAHWTDAVASHDTVVAPTETVAG